MSFPTSQSRVRFMDFFPPETISCPNRNGNDSSQKPSKLKWEEIICKEMLPSQKQPHIIQGVAGFGNLPRGNLVDFKSPTNPSCAETKPCLTRIYQTSPALIHNCIFI